MNKQTMHQQTIRQTVEKKHAHQSRIIGGEPSANDDWPWMVALIHKHASVAKQFCGGSLVAPSWVVTAAHCVVYNSPDTFEILYGDVNLNGKNAQRISVRQILIHPDYDNDTFDSDIAMIELSSSLENISTIPYVSESTNVAGQEAIVMGWGKTGESLQMSDNLLQVQVPVVSNEICSQAFIPGYITDNMICAGAAGKDSCSGDSGGPMIVSINGKWVLAGLVSWGIGCAREDSYGVYTRISRFSSFIVHCIESDVWVSQMVATAPNQKQISISFGVDMTASEQVLPSQLPGTKLDFGIENPAHGSTCLQEQIYTTQSETIYIWHLSLLYDIPNVSESVQLSWLSNLFSEKGRFVLLDGKELDSPILVEDMRSKTTVNISQPNIRRDLTICWCPDPVINLQLHQGWNLISCPFIHIFSPDSNQNPQAYRFSDGSYYHLDSFIPGQGYWYFSENDDILSITGIPCLEFSANLAQGWHLLGSISERSVPVSVPGDCIETIVQLDGNKYVYNEIIEPGAACWIYITSDCNLRLLPVKDQYKKKSL
jgi:hypothetical protein